MKTSYLKFTTIGLLLIATSQWSVAYAQIEEIVVTAQKRVESVQDVPIAINVLSGDQLDDLGVLNSDNLVALYPNLSLKATNTVNSGFAIRGVGTDNFHITAQQAVGTYSDEVSLASPFTSQFAFFDLERVEVLRGPQNTLFGRNTTGGAVNFISNKPDPDAGYTGYLRAIAGNEGKLDGEFAIGFPLGDTWAARLAGQTVNRDGVFHDVVDNESTGAIERHSGRLQLMWLPSDVTQIQFNVHVGYNRSDRGPYKSLGFWEAGSPNIGSAGARGAPDCPLLFTGSVEQRFSGLNNCVAAINNTVVNPSTTAWNDVRDVANNTADIDFEGGFVKIDHDFTNMTLTSITSYDTIDVQLVDNAPSNNVLQFAPGQEGEYDIFGQELRLASATDGSFRWIGGLYYSHENDILATIIRNAADGAPPFTVVPSVAIDQEVDIFSAYGQVEYDLSDVLTLTAGLRYTDDEKTGVSVSRVIAGTTTGFVGDPTAPDDFLYYLSFLEAATVGAGACPPAPLPCVLAFDVEQRLKEWGGKIGLDWSFNESSMAYIGYSRGFKSGAFDTRALAAFAGNADKPVGPEFLDAYEIGIKSNLVNNTLELNAALFYYEWEDLQTFATDPNGAPAFLNVPKTEITGAELEFKWAPGIGWYVQGGLAWLDSEIVDGGGLISVKEGASLSATPEFTLTGMIRKDVEMDSGMVSLQTTFNYADDINSSTFDSTLQQIESSFFINARASYVFGDKEQYEVAVWGENLGEEKACARINENGPFQNGVSCMPNAGMAFYGISAQISF